MVSERLFHCGAIHQSVHMPFDELAETVGKLGLPKERADELRQGLMENVFSIEEEGEGRLLEVEDPDFVSESYLLEKEGEAVRLTSGDLELGDGKHSEFCILMDVVAGPDEEERCRGFEVVYSKVFAAEPEVSRERSRAEVAIIKALCEGHGHRVVSTASGLVPLDLPRELVSSQTTQFYKDLLLASEQAIDKDLLDAEEWRRKASALYFFGELDKAEEALHGSLVLVPNVAWPFMALGYIHLYKGNDRLARWLFRKGQDALSRVTLGRDPLAAMDLVHPRGRPDRSRNVKGDWFEEDLCPNCDRRSWKNIDGVKGMCPKCGYQYLRKDVEVPFRVLPKRCFYLIGEPIVLELHVGNTLGLDIEIQEEGGTGAGIIQLKTFSEDGVSAWEGIDTSSALGREVIPARTRFSTELKLTEAIPSDSPFWKPLAKGGLLEVYGSFSARIKDPPSKHYRGVEVLGAAPGTFTVEVLDLK